MIELQKIVDDYLEGKGNDSVPLSAAKIIDGVKQFVFLDRYFIEPHNSAGSDDYHSFSIIARHNMREVFSVEFKKMIAYTNIYEKIDASQPAYVVLYSSEHRPKISLISW